MRQGQRQDRLPSERGDQIVGVFVVLDALVPFFRGAEGGARTRGRGGGGRGGIELLYTLLDNAHRSSMS